MSLATNMEPIVATWFRKKLEPGFLSPIYGAGIYPEWFLLETDGDIANRQVREALVERMRTAIEDYKRVNEVAGYDVHFYDVQVNALDPDVTRIGVGLQLVRRPAIALSLP